MKRAILSVSLGLGLVMSVAATTASAAGDAKAGKTIAGSCFACHGQGGKSPTNPEYPKLAGQNAEYLALQLKVFRAGERSGGNAALMQPMAMGLSDTEIENLAAYFASVK